LDRFSGRIQMHRNPKVLNRSYTFTYNVIEMVFAKSRIKRWGHSLGIILPQKAVKKMDLKEDQIIVIDINKRNKIDGFGMCRGADAFQREKEVLDRI